MNPTTIKYGLMALAFIGWTTAVYFYATGHEARKWEAAHAALKAEAADTLTKATQAARDKENADAERARQVDEVYQAMLNDAYAGRDSFNERLRIARRGQSCADTASGQAAHPRGGENVAPLSNDGPGGSDPAGRLRDAALELQRYAVACHSWAIQVGR